MTATSSEQVRVQFRTKDESIDLPEKTGPILVPTNLKRYALSTLVNTLRDTDSTIPFAFLINGQFLRSSISEYLSENGISAETVLPVEYIRAQLPPKTVASFEHDDWVSSIDVLSSSAPISQDSNTTVQPGHERILSGNFDGLLRLWDMSGNILATSKPPPSIDGRPEDILSCKFISPNKIASAGFDARIRLWSFDNTGPDITPDFELYGHLNPVTSLAVHAPSSRLLSASEDKTAKIWSTSPSIEKRPPPSAPRELLPASFVAAVSATTPSAKRQKRSTSSLPAYGPIATLTGHTRPLTDIAFHPKDPTAAYTTSQDQTLRTWDILTGQLVKERTPALQNGLSCVCPLPALGLVAVGTVAPGRIVLVDPRESATRTNVMVMRGHRGQVTRIVAEPVPGKSRDVDLEMDTNASQPGARFASAGIDGTVRIWDARNVKRAIDGGGENDMDGSLGSGVVGEATGMIARASGRTNGVEQGGKVWGLCWDAEVGIVSGGEDKMVQVDRAT